MNFHASCALPRMHVKLMRSLLHKKSSSLNSQLNSAGLTRPWLSCNLTMFFVRWCSLGRSTGKTSTARMVMIGGSSTMLTIGCPQTRAKCVLRLYPVMGWSLAP